MLQHTSTTCLRLQHASCYNMPLLQHASFAATRLFCCDTPLLQRIFAATPLIQHTSCCNMPPIIALCCNTLPVAAFCCNTPPFQRAFCCNMPILQHIFSYYAHLLQHETHTGIIHSTTTFIYNPLCYLQRSIPFDCTTQS
jgi:hypothetical protein